MRQHITLTVAMDEALRVEVDLATPRHDFVKSWDKKKWEGRSDSSKKKKKKKKKKNFIVKKSNNRVTMGSISLLTRVSVAVVPLVAGVVAN